MGLKFEQRAWFVCMGYLESPSKGVAFGQTWYVWDGYNQLDQKTEVWTAHGPCALLDFSYRSLCFPRTKEELTRAGETSNFPLWSCLIYKAKNKIYFL
jgi:hypothetical protein